MAFNGGLRGVWLKRLAIGGLLPVSTALIGLALGYSLPRDPVVPGQQVTEGPASNYRPGGSRCDPKVVARLGTDSESNDKRDRCAAAAEEQRQQQHTTNLAIRSTDIAERELQVAQGQARSGFVQTITTILALVAAAVAAFFAMRAAIEGKNSADAAREGADIARQALHTDRAWLIVNLVSCSDPVQHSPNSGRWTIDLELKISNFGKSSGILRSANLAAYWVQGNSDAEPDPESDYSLLLKCTNNPNLHTKNQGSIPKNPDPIFYAHPSVSMGDADIAIPEGEDTLRITTTCAFSRSWDGSRDDDFHKHYIYCKIFYEDIRGMGCVTSFYKVSTNGGPAQDLQDKIIGKRYNYRK